MLDATAGGLIMIIDMYNAYELYERRAKNQSMWPSEKEVQRKIASIYNVDLMIVFIARMDIIMRKFNNLTHYMNIVQLQLKCA